MLPPEHPDRIHVASDDHRLVANAGLTLPVTLAQRLGLGELVDRHVDLGRASGRANTGDKTMTLVASALARGGCINDANALRTGSTGRDLGRMVKVPSTLGTYLRSFRWDHVLQLDRVSRELLVRGWTAGAGPGDDPLTIDPDSAICETFGLAEEGTLRHDDAGVGAITRCWPSPPSPATCRCVGCTRDEPTRCGAPPKAEVDTITLVGRHWSLRSEGFYCQAPNLTHPGNSAQSVPQACRFTGLRSLNAHSPVYGKLRPTPVYSNPSASMDAASSAFLPSNTNRGGRIPRAMASQSALVISLHSVISATT